ncbi:hypothetical protein Bca52824_019720 [Brassica carinata]|uniref:Uncharacterized protein n=1 Tax=Brassica carinata TaxID=52824 RepID=A0A8X8AZY4_BRACI|nr:hypothetical protein Bca52824_019720 [Brassica carinata]
MNVTGQTAFTLWRTPSDPSPGLYSLKLSPSFNEFQLLHNETTPHRSTETRRPNLKPQLCDVYKEWLEAGKLQRVVLVIMSKATGEVLERWNFQEVVAGGGWQEVSILGGSDSADPDLGRRQLYYVTRERQESFQELSPMKFLILSPKVHATLIDLVHKFVNETVLESGDDKHGHRVSEQKWEGRKNATPQLVYMEFSNLTVVFFRSFPQLENAESVVLGCGRCGSEEETFRLIKNQ